MSHNPNNNNLNSLNSMNSSIYNDAVVDVDGNSHYNSKNSTSHLTTLDNVNVNEISNINNFMNMKKDVNSHLAKNVNQVDQNPLLMNSLYGNMNVKSNNLPLYSTAGHNLPSIVNGTNSNTAASHKLAAIGQPNPNVMMSSYYNNNNVSNGALTNANSVAHGLNTNSNVNVKHDNSDSAFNTSTESTQKSVNQNSSINIETTLQMKKSKQEPAQAQASSSSPEQNSLSPNHDDFDKLSWVKNSGSLPGTHGESIKINPSSMDSLHQNTTGGGF